MSTSFGLERHSSIIAAHLASPWRPEDVTPAAASRLAVTLSRQSGSGAHVVAEKLAEYLAHHTSGASHPWTVYDRNLVQRVIEDHQLPGYLERFMPEDRISGITEVLHELLGSHPTASSLAWRTAETIYRLAESGNVILIGRGANVVTSHLKNVFHVRLVASLPRRVAHVRDVQGLNKKDSLEFILREDRGRRLYLKKYFNEDLDDPTLYHLTVNTDLMSYDETATLIGQAMLARAAAMVTHSVF